MRIVPTEKNNLFFSPRPVTCIRNSRFAVGAAFLSLSSLLWNLRFSTASYSFMVLGVLFIGIGTVNKCQQVTRKAFKSSDNFGKLSEDVFGHICSSLNYSNMMGLKMASQTIKKRVDAYVVKNYPIISQKLKNNSPSPQGDSNHFNIISELCERDPSDHFKTLDSDHLQNILISLKDTKESFALNAVFYRNQRDFSFFVVKDATPLQYWARKGNLEFVKLLIESGAQDYCTVSGNAEVYSLSRQRSALFHAAIAGHLDVVNYLLQMGAHACVQFDGLASRSFIPDFIFQIDLENEISKGTIDSFKKILEYMAFYYPKNLSFQLQIPIENGSNSITWIKKGSSNNESKKALQDLLYDFGAREKDLLSKNEFKESPIMDCYFGQPK